MNEMYRQVMQDTLDQIEDLSKRLSRPIKDLDDIRVTMAAQKELRENEITIDLSLGPIEVFRLRTVALFGIVVLVHVRVWAGGCECVGVSVCAGVCGVWVCAYVRITQAMKYTVVPVLVAGILCPFAQVSDSRCQGGNGAGGHAPICLGEAQHSCCEHM